MFRSFHTTVVLCGSSGQQKGAKHGRSPLRAAREAELPELRVRAKRMSGEQIDSGFKTPASHVPSERAGIITSKVFMSDLS
jgi:hypothetical protein